VFDVAALGSADGRGDVAKDLPLFGREIVEHLLCDGVGVFVGEPVLVGFIVRLNKGDDVSFGSQPGKCGWEGFGLQGPAEVEGDELTGVLCFRRWGDVQSVGAFEGGDAWVLSKFPGELAVGGIDSKDVVGMVLEQTIGESADGTAKVCADEVCDVEVEGLEGCVELEAATRGIGVGRRQARLGLIHG